MKKIVVIDDDPIDVQLIEAWFTFEPTYIVVKHFYNGIDAVRYIDINETDICIVDMRMPFLNGVETMVLLRQKGYKGIMLGVSHAFYHEDSIQSEKVGANGYCEKTMPIILNTLNRINKEAFVFDRELYKKWENASKQNKLHTKDEDGRKKLLNPHFKKILTFTYQGLTTTQMADAMKLKKHTVEQYRANMLQELGFANICQATTWAILNNVFVISELPIGSQKPEKA